MDLENSERPSGSYALLKVHNRQDRLGVMQAIAGFAQVLSSDAVDGDYDIILLVRELPSATIEQFVNDTVRKLDGVKEVEICHVELTVDSSIGGKEQLVKSVDSGAECYLFLETDRRHFEDVFSALSDLFSVTSCEVASGRFSLVLRIKSDSFDSLDKFINDRIRPLPGVLRAKENRIIKLAGF